MTPEYTNQLATKLLLSEIMGVLAIGILLSCLVLLYVRRRQTQASGTLHKDEAATAWRRRYQPSIFDHTCRWLVVKSTEVSAVQSALGLHNAIPCSWGEGLSRLTSRKLFVSPPISGWILVIGQGLPDPSDDIDRCYHFVIRLSRALGHVQFFSAHRALNHHAWVRAEGGQIRRAYAWAGETLWNQGALTQAEIDLGMKCLEYGERTGSVDHGEGAWQAGHAEKVILLAARWSFDPSTVDESMLRVGLGVAGDLIHSRPH